MIWYLTLSKLVNRVSRCFSEPATPVALVMWQILAFAIYEDALITSENKSSIFCACIWIVNLSATLRYPASPILRAFSSNFGKGISQVFKREVALCKEPGIVPHFEPPDFGHPP